MYIASIMCKLEVMQKHGLKDFKDQCDIVLEAREGLIY